jgi:hypothetical protein
MTDVSSLIFDSRRCQDLPNPTDNIDSPENHSYLSCHHRQAFGQVGFWKSYLEEIKETYICAWYMSTPKICPMTKLPISRDTMGSVGKSELLYIHIYIYIIKTIPAAPRVRVCMKTEPSESTQASIAAAVSDQFLILLDLSPGLRTMQASVQHFHQNRPLISNKREILVVNYLY